MTCWHLGSLRSAAQVNILHYSEDPALFSSKRSLFAFGGKYDGYRTVAFDGKAQKNSLVSQSTTGGLFWGWAGGRRGGVFGGLRVEPGVVETFSGRGSFFRNHLQHG